MSAPNERNWACNNCGHGAENRPDRICNCNCHEAYNAAIERAAKLADEYPLSDIYAKKHIAERIRALTDSQRD